MATEADPIKPHVSEAKRLANIKNAQLSTGPRTAEGKMASRANAVKHGLYAETVAIPGEDGDLFNTRFGRWTAELNPLDSEAVDYIVAQLVRKSIRLDRCHLVYDSTIANLARNVRKVRDRDRARRIEQLVRMFLVDDGDIAVRELREFPEGCAYLIKEWESFAVTLAEPAHWDAQDDGFVTELMGRFRTLRSLGPWQLMAATTAMVEHREVAAKLKANERPELIKWEARYRSESAHDLDRERVVELARQSAEGKVLIETTIADAIAELRSRQAELEAADLLDSPLAARFDDSDRARLMHRHESDLERGFHRGLREAREMTRFLTQVQSSQKLAPSKPWVATPQKSTSSARNEATDRSARGPSGVLKAVEHDGFSMVDVSIVPEPGYKPRQ